MRTKKSKEEIAAVRKLWEIKNAEILKEKKRAYVAKNKEKISARNKAWRERNAERMKKWKEEDKIKNRERILENGRRYREKNKEKYKKLKLKKKQEAYFYLIDLCKKNPCVKCGEDDFELLEFDHIDMHTKNRNISDIAQEGNMKKMLEELKLCQVLCVKCHRKKTIKELGHYAFLTRE